MKVTLPDGTIKEYEGSVSAAQVAADIGPGLAKAAIGAKIDGELWDLNRPIDHDCSLAIITRPRLDIEHLLGRAPDLAAVDTPAPAAVRHGKQH